MHKCVKREAGHQAQTTQVGEQCGGTMHSTDMRELGHWTLCRYCRPSNAIASRNPADLAHDIQSSPVTQYYLITTSVITESGVQVHYDLWYHGALRPSATWLRVSPSRDLTTGPASGASARTGLNRIYVVDSSQTLSHETLHGSPALDNGGNDVESSAAAARGPQNPDSEPAQQLASGTSVGTAALGPDAFDGGRNCPIADPSVREGPPGSVAMVVGINRSPAGAAPTLAAAAPVRARPQRSVWAAMEYAAMPRWGFMDWLRFFFYRFISLAFATAPDWLPYENSESAPWTVTPSHTNYVPDRHPAYLTYVGCPTCLLLACATCTWGYSCNGAP